MSSMDAGSDLACRWKSTDPEEELMRTAPAFNRQKADGTWYHDALAEKHAKRNAMHYSRSPIASVLDRPKWFEQHYDAVLWFIAGTVLGSTIVSTWMGLT